MDNNNLKPLVKKVDKSKKHPEDRLYLVCLNMLDMTQEWQIVKGRSAAYEYIKDVADNINYETSFIIVETVTLNERISVYIFLKETCSYFDDNFNVDDYIKGDWDENYFIESTSQEINQELIVDNSEKLDMQNILNVNYYIKQI